MKKTIQLFLSAAAIASLLLVSCSKEKDNTPAPVASFTFTTPNEYIFGSDTVSFSNSSTNADTYLWEFGDGTTSTAVNPKKVFGDNPDAATNPCGYTFKVRLTASKGGKSDTTSRSISVEYCR